MSAHHISFIFYILCVSLLYFIMSLYGCFKLYCILSILFVLTFIYCPYYRCFWISVRHFGWIFLFFFFYNVLQLIRLVSVLYTSPMKLRIVKFSSKWNTVGLVGHFFSLSQPIKIKKSARLMTSTKVIEKLILVVTDNLVVYSVTLKGYHDRSLTSTWFLSIVLANPFKVNRGLTLIMKDCGSAWWFL